ncbi:MAG TPA: recombinase family protein [Candidatus Paceibacterota bacterium]|nr:recombinase family protein [Candidatus Paceibacterota bacterium]
MKLDNSQPKKELRAAIYLRVSTLAQSEEDAYGLDVQEERARKFCTSQGYLLDEAHLYTDKISGGTRPEEREGLSKLLAAAERGEFDCMLVYKIDRVARNLKIFLGIVEQLLALKLIFRSVTEPIDTSTPIGEMVMQILAMFAQFERGMIRDRTMSGRIQAAKHGSWVGSVPPYGYILNKTTRRLEINPKEGKIVKQIFKWLVDDKLAVHEIERRLNAMQVPAPWSTKISTKETQNVWRKFSVIRVLVNEVHTGTFYYRKFRKPFNGLTSITDPSRLRPREDWIEQHCDPIITTEMYEAAKRQLTHNREFARRNRKHEYLFSKIIYCSGCKHKMFGGFQPAREEWGYQGGRYYHGVYRKDDALGKTARCQWCPNYSEARLEPVWDCLKDILKNPKNMTRPLEKYIHKEKDPLPVKQRLQDIDTALDTISRKRDRVDALYINEQLDEQKYKAYQVEFKQDEQRLRDEQTHLRQTLLSKREVADRQKAVQRAYEQVKARLDAVTYDEKAKIVSYFVERITLHAKENYAEVVFRFSKGTDIGTVATLQGDKAFPLVHKINTIPERERRATLMATNPEMFVSKVLV